MWYNLLNRWAQRKRNMYRSQSLTVKSRGGDPEACVEFDMIYRAISSKSSELTTVSNNPTSSS
jgi:hypothetical protein